MTKILVSTDSNGNSSIPDFKALHEEFGGGVDFTAWKAAFVATPVMQQLAGITLSEIDGYKAIELLSNRRDEYTARLKSVNATIRETLQDVLASITKEQIDEGEIHKVGKGATANGYGIVEYYLKLTGASVKDARKDRTYESHVEAELDAIEKSRQAKAARRKK